MTDVATCSNCGRTPVAEGYSRSYGRCDNVYGDGFCQTLTITRLRSDLATLQAKYDALAAAHAKPSPELTAVEVAERAVVEAAVERLGDYDEYRFPEIFDAVRELLAERAKAGR